ncbi:MAG: indole-3-glycerol phosphate synthase TrpC [Planctomycetaceae bacterium]|nr:indole-3-glycerol phosphate synthase TrpC [Planctomycetaceae bacterium]
MSDVLQKIVEYKREEIVRAKAAVPFEDLVKQLASAPPIRDFVSQLRLNHPMGVIAEVKKASPSAGIIREDFHPVEIAKIYEQNGAACISVLTDEHFFQGDLSYLKAVRAAVELPLIRKDFILDRYQIAEARVAGADCVLLIAECLDDDQLKSLFQYTRELGMQALVELYDEENLQRVLNLNPHIIGVNNRNLRTFETDLKHSMALQKKVRETILFVSESGIKTNDDVKRLSDSGIHAILVGESLMRSEDIGQSLRDLLGN